MLQLGMLVKLLVMLLQLMQLQQQNMEGVNPVVKSMRNRLMPLKLRAVPTGCKISLRLRMEILMARHLI